MNTPRLRRGGGIASSSFIFYLYWYSYIVYFVYDSASDGAMGSTSFLGFSYPNLLLVFSEPVTFRNLHHIFLASVGAISGSFYFIFIFMYLISG